MAVGGIYRFAISLCCAVALLVGCRSTQYVPDQEYAQLNEAVEQTWDNVDAAAQAVNPVVQELAGAHPVDTYIGYALNQNPDIQAARKRVEAAAMRVPQAASLKNPMLKMTAYPEQVQTAAGEQEFQLAASQHLPWFHKLETRAGIAEQETERMRAELAAVELSVVEQVKRAYYELYYLEQTIRIVESDKKLLKQFEEIVDIEYRVKKKVSQQDLLRVQLESSLRDDELTRLRQKLHSAQARLARVLHISPDTPLRAAEQLADESIPGDLARLYRRAVAARPELQSHLLAVERDRQGVDLARLQYYPDVTLGLAWVDTASSGISPVANGRDAVMLSAAVDLPIYRRRIEAGISEAEARAVASAQQYDSMRDRTLEEVKDLFEQAVSQRELLRLLAEDIIPKAEQTLEVSKQAYEVGQVDFLQVIDNWRRLLRFQISQKRLQSQLRQTLAKLEQVVGGEPQPDDQPQPAAPLHDVIPLPPLNFPN